ncbi:SH3 domain-containing protein [Leptospira neocaledonica]|uniref:SH3b domain-containing protein n=1 Tax=Leptospira neocaledonica TaxID=2023192 RepID=A0A2N0A1P5_9LEPT|nr:SH3 domain-containing protein [Leptospira neocaledonica]PJZ78073.1 hypothetical protein CH365_06555 [Leptospira neocaledonica]
MKYLNPFNSAFFFLILVVSFFWSCASSGGKGFGYVTGNAVSLYEKPSAKSKKLVQIGSSSNYEVIEAGIPDKENGSKVLWYKISSPKGSGYLSYDEELVKANIATFLPPKNDRFALVTANPLQLREQPTLKSKVLAKLPAKTLVEIQNESKQESKLDGKSGSWLQIKTTDGKSGYAYSAYLMRAATAEELKAIENLVVSDSGWADVIGTPNLVYRFENGKFLFSKKPSDFPGIGQAFPFENKVITPKSKVFYSFGKSNIYVGSEFVKTYPDYSTLSLRHLSPDFDKKLAEAIIKNISKDTDFEKTTYEETSFGKRSIYQVSHLEKKKSSYEEYNILYFFLKDGGNYTMLEGDFRDVDITDIDNDGTPEIVSSYSEGRSGYSYTKIYRFNGSKFELLIQNNDECSYITYSSGSGTITENTGLCEGQTNREITYKLVKGKLVQN